MAGAERAEKGTERLGIAACGRRRLAWRNRSPKMDDERGPEPFANP